MLVSDRIMAVTTIVVISWLGIVGVEGHGRLIEPPSRSSMWRYGFDTPPNYNDHELYCGGFSRQWDSNGGKCGICGDPWDAPQPRANEAGGRFGNGVITRRYRKNQLIKIGVELTANHMGHFEFRLCPNNNPKRAASQTCLDRYILRQVDGTPFYYPGPGTKVFEMHYYLPKDLTCSQCVLQWRYIAGNNWGMCNNRTGAVGCGPQEEFRACSDVTVMEEDGSANSVPNLDRDVVVIVPPTDTVDDDYNAVSIDWEQDDDAKEDVQEEEKEVGPLVHTVSGEGIAIIILATLLTAFVLFAAVFLYYYKAKTVVDKFIEDANVRMPSRPRLPSMPNAPSWASMPRLSSMPGMSGMTKIDVRKLCKLNKLSSLAWPLSNISFSDKLPSFKKTSAESAEGGGGRSGGGLFNSYRPSSVSSASLSTIDTSACSSSYEQEPRVEGPVPPPRTRRVKSRSCSPGATSSDDIVNAAPVVRPACRTSPPRRPPPPPAASSVTPTSQPQLATIKPRPHPRLPAAAPPGLPPPPLPASRTPFAAANSAIIAAAAANNNNTASQPPAILDISAPTEVTINGVTFKKPSPMSNTIASGPTPSSSGVICSARPAQVMADMPDSSLEMSLPPQSTGGGSSGSPPPPPLPNCSPPDSLNWEDCTDA